MSANERGAPDSGAEPQGGAGAQASSDASEQSCAPEGGEPSALRRQKLAEFGAPRVQQAAAN